MTCVGFESILGNPLRKAVLTIVSPRGPENAVFGEKYRVNSTKLLKEWPQSGLIFSPKTINQNEEAINAKAFAIDYSGFWVRTQATSKNYESIHYVSDVKQQKT